MAGLPTGTVTFLFSDIEGSTRLADRRRDEWGALLEQHRRILRAAFGAHHGHEVKTEGDGFFVAFADAGDAIRAAVDAQVGMQRHPWPGDEPLRVRIGLHTGPAEVVDDDYIGLAVHHAARVSGGAHGGQVVLSDATRQVASSALLGDIELADLGLHALKDIDAPMRLHQAAHPDLQSSFPALRSSLETPNNLPQSLTSFVGRGDDILTVQKLVADHRLVTLMGAGGAGKTRLATEVARTLLDDRPGGVWLVELAPIADGSLVSHALAEALGLRPSEATPPIDLVVKALGDRRALVILDNCEHVVSDAAELAAAVLQRTPELRIIATSREALGCAGEHAWKVPSLAVRPDQPDDALLETPAVRLFLDRAYATGASFAETPEVIEAVAQICDRLDGIPLAIELAAARARAMSPTQIAERLDDRFRLLTGGSRGAMPRQQTLQALVDWSHNLLDERERGLLRRLSVFAGGFTLEAAEAVCPDDALDVIDILDGLDGLVSKSLVQAPSGDEDRYRLLETIRHYARQKLIDADEVGQVRDAHLACFAELAERGGPQLMRAEQASWLARFGREHDNLRIALEWALGTPGRREAGARILVAAWNFWWMRGYWREAADAIDGLLQAEDEVSAFHRGRLRFSRAQFLTEITGVTQMEDAEAALAMQEASGDVAGAAYTHTLLGRYLHRDDTSAALAHFRRGEELAREAGDEPMLARALALQSLVNTIPRREQNQLLAAGLEVATRVGSIANVAWIKARMADKARIEADMGRAHALATEAVDAYRASGDLTGLSTGTMLAGLTAIFAGRWDEGAELFDESLDLLRRAGAYTGSARCNRAVLAVLRDEPNAWEQVEGGLAEQRETDEQSFLAELNSLAWLTARCRPLDDRMAALVAEAERRARASSAVFRFRSIVLHTVAEVRRAQGEDAVAAVLFQEVLDAPEADGNASEESALGLAWTRLNAGDDDGAAALLATTITPDVLSELIGSKLLALAELCARRGRLEDAARLLGAGAPRLGAVAAMPDVALVNSLEARLRSWLGDAQYSVLAAELVARSYDELMAEGRRVLTSLSAAGEPRARL